MLRACVLLVAVMASLCGLTMADVTLSKTQITPSPGKTNSVTCTVTGETFRGWFKPDNTKVSTSKSDKIYVETTGNAHKLKLTDVKVSYGGTYECRGSLKTASLIVHVEFDTSGVVKVQHIEIGKDDTIKLGVTGYPEPKYTWKKGTTVLNPKSNSRYTLLDGGSLKISKVTRSDRGNYTCDIEQDGSEDKVEIEVYAVEHPEIKPFAQTNRYLTEDYPATFLCEATGYPPPQYKWYSPKGTELNSFGNIQIQGGNLTFIKVTSAFEKGEYKCKAYIEIEETKEQVGEDEASVKVVDVYVAPKIDPTQGGKADLKKGNDFKMTCKATGNPLPTVTWTRNGVIDPRQQNIPGQSVIEFRNIQVGDSGVYTCEAKNTAVDNNGNIIVKRLNKTINVESKPVIDSIASPSNVYSFVGNSDPTLVRCKYGGYPTPWVVMTFGGKVKSNSTGTAEIKVITNAIKYFGDYKCYARNKFGWTNYTVKLQKADSPSEVQNLKAEPTCDSVKLSWIRPNDNGGMPINKYVLNYEAITRNVDGDATTYTIRKLKRNTKYSITLRATNRAEWGPISSVETETTQYCAPGRPIIYSPKSSLLTTDSLTLKWRRPENTGDDSDITYTLRYRVEREGNPGPWTEITTKELEADITELDDKVDYRFELTAKNQGGESGVVEKYFKTNFPEERGSQSRLMSSAILTLALGGLYLLL